MEITHFQSYIVIRFIMSTSNGDVYCDSELSPDKVLAATGVSLPLTLASLGERVSQGCIAFSFVSFEHTRRVHISLHKAIIGHSHTGTSV